MVDLLNQSLWVLWGWSWTGLGHSRYKLIVSAVDGLFLWEPSEGSSCDGLSLVDHLNHLLWEPSEGSSELISWSSQQLIISTCYSVTSYNINISHKSQTYATISATYHVTGNTVITPLPVLHLVRGFQKLVFYIISTSLIRCIPDTNIVNSHKAVHSISL